MSTTGGGGHRIGEGTTAAVTGSGAAKMRAPVSWWVAVIALVQLAVLVATSTGYGYHRDEMYFIVAGAHPAFGYPDQPPLVPLLSWAVNVRDPGSLPALRLPSALAAGCTTVLAALIARELGGRPRAQVIAASCTATSVFALAVGHFVTTTTFDLLTTTALCWLVTRAVSRRSGPPLLAAGAVVGIGSEVKPQVALVALILLVVLAAVGPRWPLRSAWLAAGAVAAVGLAAPYVVWQAAHGWPQLTVARNIGGSAEGGRAGFVPFQLVMVSPLLVPIWCAGLIAPWRRAALQAVRFIPYTYGLLALIYVAGNGKAYYLASLYPALLGLGSVTVADWTRRHRPRRRVALLSAAVTASAALGALIALPLLPATALQGSVVMALNPDQGETVGWPAFITTVSRAWQSIPNTDRAHTVIFTRNYGEAAAVDLLGHSRGLPAAYSGHNGFSQWGHPPAQATAALLIGYQNPLDAAPYFDTCTTLVTVNNGVGLDNQEQGQPILLCHPTMLWPSLWPLLRHDN